ncbi:MAG: M90 family metallopeptidase [Akkermansiaceae bacterium]
MIPVWIILGAVLLVVITGGAHRWHREKKRAEVRVTPLEEWQRALIRAKVAFYTQLPVNLRRKLDGAIQVFLHEVGFEACGGLREITDEMRLVIGAQACLLLVESGYCSFGKLRSILVYPDAYQAKSDLGVESIRLGESWQTGSVVLSWESVVQGSKNPEDGLNVVIHEFAHQIDQFDGVADGLPILERRSDYQEWAQEFRASFRLLCDRVEAGKRTVLDQYGATNPAEFFAVATETFFEKPDSLQEAHPALYDLLKRFYGLDPLAWH